MDERERFLPAYGVHERRSIPLDELLAALRQEGWPTYVVDGAPRTRDAFQMAVSRSVPTDPPVQQPVWDALSDSIWEGLHKLGAEKVAIVWPGSAELQSGDATAYRVAIEIFTALVFSLADKKYTVDHVTRLLVLLA